MKVLIIEDEEATARRLEKLLLDIDPAIRVIDIHDSIDAAVSWYKTNTHPDLVFQDIHLADGSCFEIFRQVRVDAPVIFITARDAEEDIVEALNAGADDYLVKPVRKLELMSRIEAVMRRARPHARSQKIEIAQYCFELQSKRVTVSGEPVELTDKEFELAVFLFRNLGRLLSRGHMLEAVWGQTANLATRTVDTHVSRVRSKLNLRPDNGFRLVPTYNYGYRLEQLTDEQAEHEQQGAATDRAHQTLSTR